MYGLPNNVRVVPVIPVCLQDNVCENYIGSVYGGGYCGLSESGLCVFGKLCPDGILEFVKVRRICYSL